MEPAERQGMGWSPAPALSSGQCAGSTGREVPADRGLSDSNGDYKSHLVNRSRSTKADGEVTYPPHPVTGWPDLAAGLWWVGDYSPQSRLKPFSRQTQPAASAPPGILVETQTLRPLGL